MSASVDRARGLRTAWESSRRWLLNFASSATVFSVLHHVDHVARGNHSGWPFTFSLLIYVLILPGIYLTAGGRDVAGYHLFVAVTGLALLGTVHFAPTGEQGEVYRGSSQRPSCSTRLGDYAHGPDRARQKRRAEAANEPWPILH